MSNQVSSTTSTKSPLYTGPEHPEPESYFYPRRPSNYTPHNVFARTINLSQATPPSPGLLGTPPKDVSRPLMARSSPAESSSGFLRRVQQNKHGHLIEHSISPCISPTSESPLYSSGASMFSSNGMSSGDYLTPPATQLDPDNPPYIASRRDSDSLTMKGIIKKRGKTRRSKKKSHQPSQHGRTERSASCTPQGQRQNFKLRFPDHRSSSMVPSKSQNVYNGNLGNRLVQEHLERHNTPRGTAVGSPSFLKPPITRRWSSVELGTHSAWPIIPVASFSIHHMSRTWEQPPNPPANIMSNEDLLASIRRTLTTRHVPRLELPSSITLRRPSAMDNIAEMFHTRGSGTSSATPKSRSPALMEESEIATAYLITNQDIDCITALVNASLRRGKSSDDTVQLTRKSNLAPPSIQSKRPSVTMHGLVPHSGLPAHTAVTTEGVQSPYTLARDTSMRLQRGLCNTDGKQRAISHSPSTRSLHEILWDDIVTRSATTSPLSIDMSDEKESNTPSLAGTPFFTPRRGSNISNTEFIHSNDHPHGSLHKWKWACPDPPVSTPHIRSSIGSSEYFGSCEGVAKSHAQQNQKASPHSDVISFPPLKERRMTSEWITPLPDISQPEASDTTLHNVGIDANYGGASTPRRVSPGAQSKSSIRKRSAANSEQETRQTVRMRTSIFSSDQDLRRRSVLNHPYAPARTGAAMTTGSSIGASSRTRRKSSAPHIQIPDHFDTDKLGSTWKKAREDSCYPTILEPSSPEDDSQHTTHDHSSNDFHAHRQKLLKEKTPVLPGTIDRVGIYNDFTGSNAKRPSLMAGSKHKCHDCSTDSESRLPSIDWIG
ncbi:hypothetical protein PVAG01_03980 [Phlyctema vagabunda]|uniref:Uncharacterized protein n=1 Tax=Phlyctema vagabunda TaxID=108571 RepID=A0ABR4PMY4_9HELO